MRPVFDGVACGILWLTFLRLKSVFAILRTGTAPDNGGNIRPTAPDNGGNVTEPDNAASFAVSDNGVDLGLISGIVVAVVLVIL